MWKRLRLWVTGVVRRSRFEDELAAELEFHIRARADQWEREGLAPAEATRRARIEFGSVEKVKEQVRDVRLGAWVEHVVQDLRYAVRTLRRAPGFAATAILILGLGIGANTALFSAVNELLFVRIPVADPEGLVRLRWVGENDMVNRHDEWGHSAETAAGERTRASFSIPMFEQLGAANDTLSELFACAPAWMLNVSVDGQAEIASGLLVSGGYFGAIGVWPRIGRAIGPEDDDVAVSPVAMISHPFWSRRFGLDPEVVGRVITINNVPVTIVGVLPPEYTGVRRPDEAAADIHLPLAHYAPFTSRGAERDRATWSWVQIMGRLQPGVTAEQVRGNLDGPFRAGSRAAMDGYLETLSPTRRALRRSRSGTAVPGLRVDSASRGIYDPNPDSTRQAVMLGVVVLLVLLVVCANLANLLLSRATARQRELAIRLSVGATRGRLVRQLVTESLVLSGIGGGLGVLMAFAAKRLLPFGQTAPFDWRVCAFASVVSVSAALLFGLAPALRATGAGLSSRLKASTQGVGGGRTRLAKALLVAQVAVSLVLVVGAGLFLRTLGNLRAVDIGFNRANILLFRVDPELNGYDESRQAGLFDELTQSIRSVPGVQAVGHSTIAYLTDWGSVGDTIFVEGSDVEDGYQPRVNSVSPGFFETMEIPVLRGRLFDSRDSMDAPPVVVISEAAARGFFGSDDPIGRRLGNSRLASGRAEIVGVVRDVKNSNVRTDAPPTVYWPHVQESYGAGHFAVRTAGSPAALTSAVRAAVRRVDDNLPLMDVSTQAQQIEDRFEEERLFAFAYALFGGLAMGLTAIGLFGVVSYAVVRRTNEIGIRMALGADRAGVVLMVLKESLVLVGVGVGLGVGGVFVTGRLVTSLLFGVAPTDGATMLTAVVVMVAVASIAGYLPARRAAGVDPLIALRCE